jgi:aspartate carbamoyltransferase regulatory subunit
MSKTLAVAAIKEGSVIDHIPFGQAFRIIHLLGLLDKKHKLTVGLNLPSKRNQLKDLIKIENYILSSREANEVTIFAPLATINVIRDFEVVEKIITSLPATVSQVFVCANPVCISKTEPVQSFFFIEERGKHIWLTCKYCEKTMDRNKVEVKI